MSAAAQFVNLLIKVAESDGHVAVEVDDIQFLHSVLDALEAYFYVKYYDENGTFRYELRDDTNLFYGYDSGRHGAGPQYTKIRDPLLVVGPRSTPPHWWLGIQDFFTYDRYPNYKQWLKAYVNRG